MFLKRLNGVHLPVLKNTQGVPTNIMPTPAVVTIPMLQHIGAECELLVKAGDKVKVGQKIGDSDVFISAPIHSSVAGTVKAIEDFTATNGKKVKSVVIEISEDQELSEEIVPPVINNHSDFVAAVRASGAVGLGGAGFPTHVKFAPPNLSEVDTLIVNASECEPYITSDNQTILENSESLMVGIAAIMKYLDLKRCIIGIEENKPEAIELLKSLSGKNNFEVSVLSELYPQGSEKVMIYETMGKTVPENKLPADVGVIVSNVATIAFLGEYLKDGIPLIKRRVTLEGSAINAPQIIMVKVGTSIKDMVEFAGGYKETPSKIILGGPMMGIAVSSDSYPILKQNNAIVAFDKKEKTAFEETPCIRCGACMRACPVKLMPFTMKYYTARENVEELKKLKVNICIECGCCSYVCPARQELVQSHRNGKKLIANNKN